jgi:hypothetical protein
VPELAQRLLAREPGLRLRVQVLELQLLARGLRQVQVLERELVPRRQLALEPVRQRGQLRELGQVQREVPLSALPVIRWTQPYTVFFLLSAY